MADSFRIASFNALNLLHPGVFFAGRPDDDAYSQEIYDDKIAWMVRTLREGRVDLVGFQELFSEEALKTVTERAELPHVYAPAIANGKNITTNAAGRREASGPHVGLASRFEIVERQAILDFPEGTRGIEIQPEFGGPVVKVPVTRFQRPVIKAGVKLQDGVTATVLVAHLKSKRPQILESEKDRAKDPVVIAAGCTRSLILRAAEAIALRKLVVDATQGNDNPVLLFGDLNDDLPAVTTQIISGEEPFRFAKLEDKKKEWDRLLYSVHDIEEQESFRDVSYTHIFNGRYELLDHIFVSQEFFHRNEQRIATVMNTRIFNDHLRDERRSVNPGRGPSPRSDHGIPVTEIEWR